MSYRILMIVTDLEENTPIRWTLEKSDFEVVTENPSAETSTLLSRVQPDLVMVSLGGDHGMGVTLCRELKGSEHGQAVPVVLVSELSKTELNELPEFETGGYDQCIPKSITGETLLGVCAYWLQSKAVATVAEGGNAELDPKPDSSMLDGSELNSALEQLDSILLEAPEEPRADAAQACPDSLTDSLDELRRSRASAEVPPIDPALTGTPDKPQANTAAPASADVPPGLDGGQDIEAHLDTLFRSEPEVTTGLAGAVDSDSPANGPGIRDAIRPEEFSDRVGLDVDQTKFIDLDENATRPLDDSSAASELDVPIEIEIDDEPLEAAPPIVPEPVEPPAPPISARNTDPAPTVEPEARSQVLIDPMPIAVSAGPAVEVHELPPPEQSVLPSEAPERPREGKSFWIVAAFVLAIGAVGALIFFIGGSGQEKPADGSASVVVADDPTPIVDPNEVIPVRPTPEKDSPDIRSMGASPDLQVDSGAQRDTGGITDAAGAEPSGKPNVAETRPRNDSSRPTPPADPASTVAAHRRPSTAQPATSPVESTPKVDRSESRSTSREPVTPVVPDPVPERVAAVTPPPPAVAAPLERVTQDPVETAPAERVTFETADATPVETERLPDDPPEIAVRDEASAVPPTVDPPVRAAPTGPTEPVLVHRVEPAFPMAKKHKPGTIVLNMLVSDKGKILKVIVEKGMSGAPEFESAAIYAVLNWKYQSATKNGAAVEAWTQAEFQIDDLGSSLGMRHTVRPLSEG